MATIYAKFVHNGKAQTVALCAGIGPNELVNLLKTVFGVAGEIVGIMAEKGLVIPISLVCKNPSVIPNSFCKILVTGEGRTKTPQPQVDDQSEDSDGLPAEESQLISEDESTEYVLQEILAFIDGLQQRKFITKRQGKVLKESLGESSTLLFAAFSVAVSAGDKEYFAEICDDLSKSLMTPAGRVACEAQEEVLQICDQLYIQERITENQLLYLRHLVLIREDTVATLYDTFQEHQNVVQFAKDLYELVNTHPYQNQAKKNASITAAAAAAAAAAAKAGSSKNHASTNTTSTSTRNMGTTTTTTTPQYEGHSKRPASRGNGRSQLTPAEGLTGAVALMMRKGSLSNAEGAILLEMIQNNNEYAYAAYDVYQMDRNLDDLQDTLQRCLKLEIRKRVVQAQEEERENARNRDAARHHMSGKRKHADSEDDENDEEEEESEGEEEDSQEEDSQEEEEEEGGEDDFTLEDIALESILESLNVTNVWENSVPEDFIQTVFIAVIRRHLTLSQAKALCDLYHAKYDLVLAAWEVYGVQEDPSDLIDTLRRVVRDLNFDEESASSAEDTEREEEAKVVPVNTGGGGAGRSRASAASTKEYAKPAAAPAATSSRATAARDDPTADAAKTAEQMKRESVAAVQAAKRDLLKHSLEMMVKQGIINAEQGIGLFERYINGDPLTEAAIESYAAERNVVDFLETLQVLACHSPAELDALLSREEDDEKSSDKAKAPPASATASAAAAASNKASAKKDAEDEDENVDIAQLQLRSIVVELAKNQIIKLETAEDLLRLVISKDARVYEAFETYQTVRNGADFIDTLLKLVQNEQARAKHGGKSGSPAAKAPAAASATAAAGKGEKQHSTKAEAAPAPAAVAANKSPSPTKSTTSSTSSSSEPADAVNNSKAPLLSVADQTSVVDILRRANAVTDEQQAWLHERINLRDPLLQAVFLQYEEDQDVYKLIDYLKNMKEFHDNRAKKQGGEGKPSAAAAAAEASEEEEQEEEGETAEDEEGEEEEEELDEDDKLSVEGKFLQIVQNMNLTHLETAALRLAIARDDRDIRKAIDDFRVSLDEDKLMDALREVSRQTIMTTLQQDRDGRGDMEDDDDDDEEEQEEEDSQEEEEEESEEESDDNEADNEEDNGSDEAEESDQKESYYKRSAAAAMTAHHHAPSPTKSPGTRQQLPTPPSHSATRTSPHNGGGGQPSQLSPHKISAGEAERKLQQYDFEDKEESSGDSRTSSSDEEQDDADADAEEGEEDEDDEDSQQQPAAAGQRSSNGNSLITSQAARDHVFPILINELVKEKILSGREGSTIMRQYQTGNAVISAALDVYDMDNDMAKLVDTLQQNVEANSKM